MAALSLWRAAARRGRRTIARRIASNGGGAPPREGPSAPPPGPAEGQPPSLGGSLPPLAASLPDTEFSLLELADRLLHRGVVLTGEATISVAGVELIYLGLNLVLGSVEALERSQGGSAGGAATHESGEAPGD